jgi:hypothetical protein
MQFHKLGQVSANHSVIIVGAHACRLSDAKNGLRTAEQTQGAKLTHIPEAKHRHRLAGARQMIKVAILQHACGISASQRAL